MKNLLLLFLLIFCMNAFSQEEEEEPHRRKVSNHPMVVRDWEKMPEGFKDGMKSDPKIYMSSKDVDVNMKVEDEAAKKAKKEFEDYIINCSDITDEECNVIHFGVVFLYSNRLENVYRFDIDFEVKGDQYFDAVYFIFKDEEKSKIGANELWSRGPGSIYEDEVMRNLYNKKYGDFWVIRGADKCANVSISFLYKRVFASVGFGYHKEEGSEENCKVISDLALKILSKLEKALNKEE